MRGDTPPVPAPPWLRPAEFRQRRRGREGTQGAGGAAAKGRAGGLATSSYVLTK